MPADAGAAMGKRRRERACGAAEEKPDVGVCKTRCIWLFYLYAAEEFWRRTEGGSRKSKRLWSEKCAAGMSV